MNVTIGQYFPGDSVLHRLDPRLKLILTIALIVLVFMVKGIVPYVLLFAFVGVMIAWSKIRFMTMLKGVKSILYIILLTVLLNMLFTTTGTVLFQFGVIRITREGLELAVYMAARLTLLIFCSQLLTLTTSPIALTDGIEALLRPLSKIRFPAHEIAMMMSIALRFIPTLMEEADKIMKAQKARGADFESGSIARRAKAMLPLLVPLFVSAFRRADDLALAMESRCYKGGEGRTRMKTLKYQRLDGHAALLFSAFSALALLLSYRPIL